LTIEVVREDQDAQQLFAATADLVRSNVELLAVSGSKLRCRPPSAASRTIPIVMLAINFDPIARGYVKSLARPGGNITGVVTLQTELAAKQVELLTQAFPERTRLAVLWDGNSADQFSAADRQAGLLHLDVQSLKLENPPYDFDAAFRSLATGSPQMLLVLSSPFLHFPARISPSWRSSNGCLPCSSSRPTSRRRAYLLRRRLSHLSSARFFTWPKILNGAKPDEFPVEQAVKFELVINLKTAKAIGVELFNGDPAPRRRGDRINLSQCGDMWWQAPRWVMNRRDAQWLGAAATPPNTGHEGDGWRGGSGPITTEVQYSKVPPYSITSSAFASSVSGMDIPNAPAEAHPAARRLRLRGLSGAKDEVLLTATAQNLRRLVKFLCRPPPSAGSPVRRSRSAKRMLPITPSDGLSGERHKRTNNTQIPTAAKSSRVLQHNRPDSDRIAAPHSVT